jgi:hypothetical protein
MRASLWAVRVMMSTDQLTCPFTAEGLYGADARQSVEARWCALAYDI